MLGQTDTLIAADSHRQGDGVRAEVHRQLDQTSAARKGLQFQPEPFSSGFGAQARFSRGVDPALVARQDVAGRVGTVAPPRKACDAQAARRCRFWLRPYAQAAPKAATRSEPTLLSPGSLR